MFQWCWSVRLFSEFVYLCMTCLGWRWESFNTQNNHLYWNTYIMYPFFTLLKLNKYQKYTPRSQLQIHRTFFIQSPLLFFTRSRFGGQSTKYINSDRSVCTSLKNQSHIKQTVLFWLGEALSDFSLENQWCMKAVLHDMKSPYLGLYLTFTEDRIPKVL